MNIVIDAKEELKGYITPFRTGFRVYFRDIIIKDDVYIGVYKHFEEAYQAYCDYQFKFYKEHTYILPKYIAIDSKSKMFRFRIPYAVNEIVSLYSAKSLQEVIEYRKQFIANLL